MNLIKASLTDPEEECLSGGWLTCCHSKGLFLQSLHFHCADGPLWEGHTQFRWRVRWLSNYKTSLLECNLRKKQSTESKSTQMGKNLKNFYRCLSDFDPLLNMCFFFFYREDIISLIVGNTINTFILLFWFFNVVLKWLRILNGPRVKYWQKHQRGAATMCW